MAMQTDPFGFCIVQLPTDRVPFVVGHSHNNDKNRRAKPCDKLYQAFLQEGRLEPLPHLFPPSNPRIPLHHFQTTLNTIYQTLTHLKAMSQKMPEPLPVYSQDAPPEPELPTTEPPEYLQRTPSQEAARLQSLKEWAAKRDMMNSGGYMETFNIGGQTVTNGQLVSSSSSTDYPSASQEKQELAAKYGDDGYEEGSSSSHHDGDSKPGVGKRISGFLKRISPAERAQQKAMNMTPEQEEAEMKKYPMAEGTYGWENMDSSKK